MKQQTKEGWACKDYYDALFSKVFSTFEENLPNSPERFALGSKKMADAFYPALKEGIDYALHQTEQRIAREILDLSGNGIDELTKGKIKRKYGIDKDTIGWPNDIKHV